MRTLLWVGAIALACLSTSAAAQTYPKIVAPSTIVPPSGVAFTDVDGSTKVASSATPLPVAGRQESVALATANTASAPVTLYGGTYILTQACTAYGSVALRYRAPDGTMLTLATKIAGDSGGGSTFQFGTAQIVDVLLTGTTGCNVTLSRIP
jgi:hypothetical protein